MEISFSLALPRDESSVPIVRHLVGEMMGELGVERACIEDIELALTEACTNVLKHAARHQDDYQVELLIDIDKAQFQICDTGGEFDMTRMSSEPVPDQAEGGRGMQLMRAVVDDLDVDSAPETGTVVRFRKSLEFTDDSVVQRLDSRGARVSTSS
jgi:serine/threonine-protein kinase RsbW